MFRLFKIASRSIVTRTSMPLTELKKLVFKNGDEYIELLNKKNKLEAIVNNASLTAKERCEAYPELLDMIKPFHAFETQHAEDLKTLEARLVETMSEEQKASYESSKSGPFSM